MRVRFSKDFRGRRAGTEHDLSEEEAKAAIKAKAAEEATPAGALDDEGDATMLLWFRAPVTLGGHLYAAGSKGRVKVSDEAWEAVNNGAADLQPPPGEQGQPFPPDWVSTAEAPAAPTIFATPAATAKITAPKAAADYDSMTKEDLHDLAGKRGLPVSGTKDELAKRLKDDDKGR